MGSDRVGRTQNRPVPSQVSGVWVLGEVGRREWPLGRAPIYGVHPAPPSSPQLCPQGHGSSPGLCFANPFEPAPPGAYVSWQGGWQAPTGVVQKGHLWAEQMRTEGMDLDTEQCCARAESEGNSCPSQRQEVAEAGCKDNLGPSGLQPALEIFTNAKSTWFFTGKAAPWAIFPLAAQFVFAVASALAITAIRPWAYEGKLMILLNAQTLTLTHMMEWNHMITNTHTLPSAKTHLYDSWP